MLAFRYKVKDGKIIPKESGMEFSAYKNCEYKLFSNENSICLADVGCRFDIPFSELRRISTVSKRYYILEFEHGGRAEGHIFCLL